MKKITLILIITILFTSCDTAYRGYYGNKQVHSCKNARGLVGYGNF